MTRGVVVDRGGGLLGGKDVVVDQGGGASRW